MKVECDECGQEFWEGGLPAHKRSKHRVEEPPWYDEDRLRRLYIDEGLSYAKIAKQFGCSQTAVGNKIRQFNIHEEKDPDEIFPTGEAHPHYKEYGEERYGGHFVAKARRARERDGYVCQWCGIDGTQYREEHGRALDVHHIIPVKEFESDGLVDRKAHKLSNLATVCRRCHRAVERLDEWQVKEVLEL